MAAGCFRRLRDFCNDFDGAFRSAHCDFVAELSHRYQFFGQIGSSTAIPNFEFVRTMTPQALEEKNEGCRKS
jgi:hypothetical protein